MEQRTVLITGVAGRWGRRLARQLAKIPIVRVIGLDIRKPDRPIEGVEYIEDDLRNPELVELLRSQNVEGILHMVFASGLSKDGKHISMEEAFQTNVMGTMELLAAASAANVKQVVVKSTTLVYGANHDNPMYLSETAPLRGNHGKPYLAQRVEIEKFIETFRPSQDMKIVVLRFPGIVGMSGASSMMRYLGQPAPPMLMGFDPLFQVVHEGDVVGSILHAMASEADGVFNIAAEGVMPISQMIRRVGRQPVPIFHPVAYQLTRLPFLKDNKLLKQAIPFEWDYLRYTWVAGLERMRDELGYTPMNTLEDTLETYRTALAMRRYSDLLPGRKKSERIMARDDRGSYHD